VVLEWQEVVMEIKLNGWSIAGALAVAGIGFWYWDQNWGPTSVERKLESQASREKRKADVQATLDAGPKIRRHALPNGEMIHIQIPKAADRFGYRVEWVDCYVWRDEALSSTSIQCPEEIKGM